MQKWLNTIAQQRKDWAAARDAKDCQEQPSLKKAMRLAEYSK